MKINNNNNNNYKFNNDIVNNIESEIENNDDIT